MAAVRGGAMTTAYEVLAERLTQKQHVWLITGVAGFIGSNLLETLLKLDQIVVGLDNFSTGYAQNLREVQALVAPAQWARFQFIEGDIRDYACCEAACQDIEFVLHQAALGSVPRSLADPILTHENNISGFLNMLVAARNARVGHFVYAASSSVYGDHPALPKVEHKVGQPLSPYAATKYVNELYAGVFARCYDFRSTGLRYFNVFGPRQDPDGAYAAVIPRWIAGMLKGDPIYINGTGITSRDFCFINNAVQANLLAATCSRKEPLSQTYNIAVNESTTLNQLFELIRSMLASRFAHVVNVKPVYREFRQGDVLHSLADISKARAELGYRPTHHVKEGLQEAMDWYIRQYANAAADGTLPGQTSVTMDR